jgi:hypothetical protein
MGVRTHIHAVTRRHSGRSHLIEKDEGPDHLPLTRWQGTMHGEIADIAYARFNYEFERVTGFGIAL